jgi:hypothetical protein
MFLNYRDLWCMVGVAVNFYLFLEVLGIDDLKSVL